MPFLLESKLLSLGAYYSRSPNYKSHVGIDCKLVTGQNLDSSVDTAKEIKSLAFAALRDSRIPSECSSKLQVTTIPMKKRIPITSNNKTDQSLNV